MLNSPAVLNSPDLADGQLVEVFYVKRYSYDEYEMLFYVCVDRKSLGEYLPLELLPPLPKKSKQESVGQNSRWNLLLFI